MRKGARRREPDPGGGLPSRVTPDNEYYSQTHAHHASAEIEPVGRRRNGKKTAEEEEDPNDDPSFSYHDGRDCFIVLRNHPWGTVPLR